MNTCLEAPDWSSLPVPKDAAVASLRQLVNAAGPLASGIAIALTLVRRAEQAESDGQPTPLDATQRGQMVAFCAVAAQMLHEVANDASNTLLDISRH